MTDRNNVSWGDYVKDTDDEGKLCSIQMFLTACLFLLSTRNAIHKLISELQALSKTTQPTVYFHWNIGEKMSESDMVYERKQVDYAVSGKSIRIQDALLQTIRHVTSPQM